MASFPATPAPSPTSAARHPGARRAWARPEPHGLAFALFVVVNGALFIRPGEVIPATRGVQFYRDVLLLCLLVGLPALLGLLSARVLERRPIALCVFGLALLTPVANLLHAELEAALEYGFEFFKVLLYFLLFLALVTTPARLRTLVTWLVLFSLVVTVLAILDYHEVIALYKIPRVDAQGKEDTSVVSDGVKRMVGTGLFQDPNDLCTLLATAIVLLLYQVSDRRWGPLRFAWLVPLAVMLYGVKLTSSRGGLLALLAGVGTFSLLRFGWRRTALLGALGLPVLFALLAGRQANISTSAGTGQERMQLWSDGLDMFRASPLFGVGVNKYAEQAGHVAHNAYLHVFSEMGFIGGGLFAGVYYLAIRGLIRLSRPVAVAPSRRAVAPVVLDPELRRLYPYLTGAVVAWAVGMLSLSLCYVVPTYTVLGLASVFLTMAATRPAVPALRFDSALAVRMAVFGVCYLVGIYLFVRLFRQW